MLKIYTIALVPMECQEADSQFYGEDEKGHGG